MHSIVPFFEPIKSFFCSTIRVCLAWYVRDKASFNMFREKGLLMPHEDTLKKYKNCISQQPGFLPAMFGWMRESAQGLRPHERVGALVLDEM